MVVCLFFPYSFVKQRRTHHCLADQETHTFGSIFAIPSTSCVSIHKLFPFIMSQFPAY